jgi:serine/threonine protein phosphatase PrpC
MKATNEDRTVALLAVLDYAIPDRLMSFFGVFDGHAGTGCAQFLQNRLIEYLLESPYFPADLERAL